TKAGSVASNGARPGRVLRAGEPLRRHRMRAGGGLRLGAGRAGRGVAVGRQEGRRRSGRQPLGKTMKATKTRAEAKAVARNARGHGEGLATANTSWAVCRPVRF